MDANNFETALRALPPGLAFALYVAALVLSVALFVVWILFPFRVLTRLRKIQEAVEKEPPAVPSSRPEGANFIPSSKP